MLIVGLTGGIASGKSLVSRVFKELGAHVIDADRIVHDLVSAGTEAWDELRAHFGDEILLPDGCIDRKRLGAIVFSDPEKREWLNHCLHPRVFEAFRTQVRRIGKSDPGALVVLDAALLVETGFHRRMDKLVVVCTGPDQQLRRLMERDGITREQALARINSQMPMTEKCAAADYVIDNAGAREDTERRAREVFRALEEEAAGRP
jgi:dephospho-CoA kinase